MYETFASKYKISHHSLIRFDDQRVIDKKFYIQNMNNYISLLKIAEEILNLSLFYLLNYLS